MDDPKIIATKIDESWIQIKCDYQRHDELYEFMSAFKKGFLMSPAYCNYRWDGKIHFYDRNRHLLPLGLYEKLKSFCKRKKYQLETVDLDRNNKKEPWTRKYLEKTLKGLINSDYTPRDYQWTSALKMLSDQKGILECCTGSGKSLIIYMIIRALLKTVIPNKILLIVPSITLVEQMYHDFESYGWTDITEYCEMQDSKHTPKHDKAILITTWQSMIKYEEDFFESVDVIIGDECHGLRGTKQSDMFKMAKNAVYKIGTTGTMPNDDCELWRVTAFLGPVLYKIRSSALIEQGILSKIIVVNVKLMYPMEFIKKNRNRKYSDEVRAVEAYENRYSILKTIIKHTPDNHNILILCNHLDHIDHTINYFNDLINAEEISSDWKIRVISGSTSASSRRKIIEETENSVKNIIVATYGTMSTGVNLKRVHDIIFFSNSKSKITVLQSIGRGLRKHQDKKQVVIYDMIDDLTYSNSSGKMITNYLYKHWGVRYKYYIEQGFENRELVYPV